MIILLHSSKTMRTTNHVPPQSLPVLLGQALPLATYIKTLSPNQLAKIMHVSSDLASKTHRIYQKWTTDQTQQSPAIDSFIGDIYSGLRADSLSQADRQYAQQTLRILSGLYGILRPLDGIMPYRLEMAYKFNKRPFDNLYTYWVQSINDQIPAAELIINTSSVEYSQTITRFRSTDSIITPQFLTVNPQTNLPVQVVVHSKIARGAFAHWLISSRVTNPDHFNQFTDLNYTFEPKLSHPLTPTFVCQDFGGIGLSQRLK